MTLAVPFADLARAARADRVPLRAAFDRVLSSGRYIGGDEVAAFEREWAVYTRSEVCVGVASGTDAIKITLRVFGKRGEKVLTVANSAPATVTAIVEAGMRPVFCDVIATGPDAGLMDLDDAARVAKRERPSVLMPVHLYGRMVDMTRAREVTALCGARLVEDACQAHGSRDRRGVTPGQVSDAACWSFYPTKNLGALGDAGAITMPSARRANRAQKRARELGNYGLIDEWKGYRRAMLRECGWNSRLDPVQAAFLRARIPTLGDRNAARARLASLYRTILQPHGIEVIAGGNCHIAAIRTDRRHVLQAHLAGLGITTQIHYHIPAHHQPCLREQGVSLPATDRWCAEVLSLPLCHFTSEAEVRAVCSAIVSFLKGRATT